MFSCNKRRQMLRNHWCLIFASWMLVLSGSLCIPARAARLIGASEAELRAALEVADHVVFASGGTIYLSNTITIAGPKRIEAGAFAVALSGSNQTRIFDVTPGGALHLINLTLFGGRVLGTNGSLREIGGAGQGGAVRVVGGSLTAWNCRFMTNNAIGGPGGNSLPEDGQVPGAGGRASGGAVSVSSGLLALSNCVFQANIARGGNGGRFFGFGSRTIGGKGEGGALYASGSSVDLQQTIIVDSQAVPGNGTSTFIFPEARGAGLYLESGSARITACALLSNYARSGAALYNDNASLIIERSILATNGATFGGALFLGDSQTAIVACTLTHNSASGRGGFHFDGIEVDAEHAYGGALFLSRGSCSISNSTFAWNTAQGGSGFASPTESGRAGSSWGGAIFSAGQITLENVTIALNRASSGRALWRDLSAGYGGGLCTIASADALLIHCTVASNSVTDTYTYSRGAGCFTSNSFSALATIFAHNFASTTEPENISGSLNDQGFNISSDSSPLFSSFGTSRGNADPMLGPLADNGGPTLTMALRPGSPAIDGIVRSSWPPFDQRGFHRPAGGHADIGAFEQAFLSIRKAADPPALSIEYKALPGAYCTLEASGSLQEWDQVGSQQADASGRVVFHLTVEKAADFFRVQTQ